MSSMRNVVQRRQHRERAQPLERQHLGLLEKHSDYAKRAKAYNAKKSELRRLARLAEQRNPDEFDFKMLSRKGPGSVLTKGKRGFTGTVNGDRKNKALDVETVRLLKTQDLGYVRTQRNVAQREVRGLEEQVILAGGGDIKEDDDEANEWEGPEEIQVKKKAPPKPAKKIVFVEDAGDVQRMIKRVRRKEVREEKEEEQTIQVDKEENEKAAAVQKLREKLQFARKKLKALKDAEYELEIQKSKMAKTRTSGGFTKRGDRIVVHERKR